MIGRLSSWNERGFGQIVVRTGEDIQRFYLHISSVTRLDERLEEPAVGCEVHFEVGGEPRKQPSYFPVAINAHVSLPAPAKAAQ